MPAPIHTVRRLNWREYLAQAPGERWLVRLPGGVAVAKFADPEDAERDRAAREGAARAVTNPFRCGHALADVTNMPAFVFKDYLQEDGVRAARPDSFARLHWDRWWDRRSLVWSPATRGRVWDALDRVRFFDVVTADPGGTAWVVVQALARGAGEVYRWSPAPEGGRLAGAYRDHRDALAAVKLLADGPADESSPADLRGLGPPRDPFRSRSGAAAREPLDRALEVRLTPYPDGSVPRRAWCVARRAVGVEMRTDAWVVGPQYWFDRASTYVGRRRLYDARGHSWRSGARDNPADWRDEDHLVPEAIFADPADADEYRADAERAARRLVNPFRFVPTRDPLADPTPAERAAALAASQAEADFDYLPRAGIDGRFPERTLSAQALRVRFAALGLPDPGDPPQPLAWAAHVQPLGDGEFHAAYDAVDGVRFYRIVEVELD